jgi:hypothetical protein
MNPFTVSAVVSGSSTDGEAHDENQRLAAAVVFVIDVDTVGAEMRHGQITPINKE